MLNRLWFELSEDPALTALLIVAIIIAILLTVVATMDYRQARKSGLNTDRRPR